MRHIQTEVGTKRQLDVFLFDDSSSQMEYIDPSLFEPKDTEFLGEHLPTWDQVQKRVNKSWDKAVNIVEDFYRSLANCQLPELASHVRRVRFNEDDGDELDYDRMLNSQPMWRKSQRESHKGNTEVTIFVDIATPANVDPEDVFWRGGAALALTKLLEESGYKVELWVSEGGQFLSDTLDRSVRYCKTITATCLKRGHDTLDVNGICNSLGGWYYRTVSFSTMSTIASKTKRKRVPTYGPVCTPNQDQLDLISQDETRILIAGVYSYSEALDCVVAELKRIQETH